MTLQQRNFFTLQKFEITNNGLKVTIKTPIYFSETEYSFESIDNHPTFHRQFNSLTIAGACVTFGFTLIGFLAWLSDKKDGLSMSFVALSLSIVFLINIMNSAKGKFILGLSNNRNLSFLPSPRMELDTFFQALIAEQKRQLLRKYSSYDPYSEMTYFESNFNWLVQKNIITSEERKQMLDDFHARRVVRVTGFIK